MSDTNLIQIGCSLDIFKVCAGKGMMWWWWLEFQIVIKWNEIYLALTLISVDNAQIPLRDLSRPLGVEQYSTNLQEKAHFALTAALVVNLPCSFIGLQMCQTQKCFGVKDDFRCGCCISPLRNKSQTSRTTYNSAVLVQSASLGLKLSSEQ